ncbi:MAG: PA0069 family radical SAM protein [Deltaproteobacteria bacterium]|nr:PA0069 family radical SAM protein [Deltaproteobacteria bacterium]
MASPGQRPNLQRVTNPPNPWSSTAIEWLEEAPRTRLEVFFDHTRDILSQNRSPDISFRWSLNPYRGCWHGCAYCYARPTHEYLGYGAGTDFERTIVVKPDAPELLRAAFERPRWTGEVLVFSGNTDCYQPLEASYELTRRCLEVCLEYRQPVGIITKATLIERDVELLCALDAAASCHVTVSLPFIEVAHARAVEPYAASPERRLRTIERLAAAGLHVGVNVAPIIPGLNDAEVPRILAAAREAGARSAGHTMLRLPGPVAGIFEARLREALPDRADKVMHAIAECRGGKRNDSRFGARMSGQGQRWDAIEALWRSSVERLGFDAERPAPRTDTFARPSRSRQLELL